MKGRGHAARRWLGTWPQRDRLASTPAKRWHGYSSHRLLDPARLSLPSQRHSTALPSPKRYDNRYELEFLENIRLYQRPRGHGGEPEDVEVRDKSQLTSFNIDGEHFLNTSSEPREWLLRASATLLVDGYSTNLTGDSRAEGSCGW